MKDILFETDAQVGCFSIHRLRIFLFGLNRSVQSDYGYTSYPSLALDGVSVPAPVFSFSFH